MRCKFCLVVLLLLLTCPWWPASSLGQESEAGQGVTEILAAMESFQHNVYDLQGRFRQVRQMALLGGSIDSEGEIFYLRPDHLLLRFTSPQENHVLVKGNDVWVYFPAQREAQHYDLGPHTNLSGLFVCLGGGEGSLPDFFDVSRSEASGEEVALVLTPRDNCSLAGEVSRVELSLDEGDFHPRQIRLVGMGGDILELTLTNVVINPGLDPALFEFYPPPGVAVTDYTTPPGF